MRDIIRRIQEMRKTANLTPAEKIFLVYEGDAADLLRAHEDVIKKSAGISEMREGRGKTMAEEELVLEGKKLWIGIRL